MNFTIFIRFLTLVFIGFANALPLPLSTSTLSIWLIESGFKKSSIGFLSLITIPLSLKILWIPLVDHLSFPFFKKSPRKGWMLFALLGISFSFFWMSFVDPAQPLILTASLFSLSLFTGCLYIVGVYYELECLEESKYSTGSACVATGYRMGLLCAGAGALYLAAYWDWSFMFKVMSLLVALGALFIALLPEPYKSQKIIGDKREQFSQYGSLWKGFWSEVVLQPCQSFLKRPGSLTILLILLFFKVGDQLTHGMQGPFYLSLGFDKITIANSVKFWGMVVSIFGAFSVAFFIKGRNPIQCLVYIGLLHSCTLLCHFFLAYYGASLWGLHASVFVENLTRGMAMTAFISFLWHICDKPFAAMQYALLWSFFSLKSHLLAFLGGWLATWYSWDIYYFIVVTAGLLTSLAAWAICLTQNQKEGVTFSRG